MSQEILYMTERELLDTTFAFIFHVEKSEDMFVPVGYREIGFVGQYKEFYSRLNDEESRCREWFPYRDEKGHILNIMANPRFLINKLILMQ